MNNEQTKTPGQIAYEAFMKAEPLEKVCWEASIRQNGWQAAAEAVISHVLQGAKYVLILPKDSLAGDEIFHAMKSEWELVDKHLPLQVNEDWPCRRPIYLPFGNSEGASTTQCAGSGDAGADVPSTWQLPPPPTGQQWHRTDGWTKEMLPEGWRPLLKGECALTGDEFFVNGKWHHQRIDYCDGENSHWNHHRTRRPLPQSAGPTTEEEKHSNTPITDAFRQLTEAAGKEIERVISERDHLKDIIDVMTGQLRGARDAGDRAKIEVRAAEAERDQLRKELESLRRKTDNRGVLSVTEEDETYREQCWRLMYNTVFQDLDEHRKKVSSLTTENAALKERLDKAEHTKIAAVRHADEFLHGLNEAAKENTRLRSQLTWTPISEAPKDGTRILAKTEGSDPHVQFWHAEKKLWMINYADGPSWQPTHFLDLSKLPPLPSPPETEEQKAGDSFNKWWQTKAHQDLAEVSGCNKATALAIWLAAKQSTGGPS